MYNDSLKENNAKLITTAHGLDETFNQLRTFYPQLDKNNSNDHKMFFSSYPSICFNVFFLTRMIISENRNILIIVGVFFK